MNKDIDILELIEYTQLSELADNGMLTDVFNIRRLCELSNKYTREDVESYSMSEAARMFGDETGHLRKQKCTNRECSYTFRSNDVSNTCDICYYPTLRIVDDIS